MLPYDLQWPDRREAEGQTTPGTHRFTNAFLDGLRREESPDPDADAAVAAIYAGGRQGLFAIPPELQQSWRVTA